MWRESELPRIPNSTFYKKRNHRFVDGKNGRILLIESANDQKVRLRTFELDGYNQLGESIEVPGPQFVRKIHYDSFGKSIVISQSDGLNNSIIRIFDAETGEPIGLPCIVDSSEVHSIRVCAKAQRIVFCARRKSDRTEVHIFDPLKGKQIGTPFEFRGRFSDSNLREQPYRINCPSSMDRDMSFVLSPISPNGTRFAVIGNQYVEGNRKGVVSIVNCSNGSLIKEVQNLGSWVTSVEFDSKNRWLATSKSGSYGQGNIDFLSIENGALQFAFSEPRSSHLAGLDREGSIAVVDGEGSNEVTKLVNLPSGDVVEELPIDSGTTAVSFSPDQTYLAMACGEKVYLVDLLSKVRKIVTLEHDAFVSDQQFSADGQVLWTLTGHGRGRLYQWQVSNGELVSKNISTTKVDEIITSSQSRLLVTLVGGGWRVFDNASHRLKPVRISLKDGVFNHSSRRQSHFLQGCRGAWSDDGGELAFGGGWFVESMLPFAIWKKDSFTQKVLLAKPDDGKSVSFGLGSTSFEFNEDASRLLVANSNLGACVWSTERGRKVSTVVHSEGVIGAGFVPYNKSILTLGRDGFDDVKFWTYNGKSDLQPEFVEHGKLKDSASVVSCSHFQRHHRSFHWFNSFGNDGTKKSLLGVWPGASFGSDGLWVEPFLPGVKSISYGNFLTGEKLGNLSQPASIEDAIISPDNALLATAGYDGVVRVWKINQPLMPPLSLDHGGDVRGIEFTRNSDFLLARSREGINSLGGGTVSVWDVENGRPVFPEYTFNGDASSASIDPTSSCLMVTSNNEAYVFGLMLRDVNETAPWVSDFASYLSGVKYKELEGYVNLSDEERFLLEKRLRLSPSDESSWGVLRDWFFKERSERSFQPFLTKDSNEVFSNVVKKGGHLTNMAPSDLYFIDSDYPLIRFALAEGEEEKRKQFLIRTAVERLVRNSKSPTVVYPQKLLLEGVQRCLELGFVTEANKIWDNLPGNVRQRDKTIKNFFEEDQAFLGDLEWTPLNPSRQMQTRYQSVVSLDSDRVTTRGGLQLLTQ